MTREQANDLKAQFEAVSEAARRLAQEYSPEELSRAPAAGAWSVADNLMHLSVASQLFVPRMTKTLGKLGAAGRRTDRPSAPDWIGRLYSWALEPPPRFRAKAPKPFVPPAGIGAEEALSAFLAEQARIEALADQSCGLDLAALKVPSPVSRHIRYNVLSAFLILVAHERRHLWQARRAAESVRAGRSGS